VEAGIGNSVVGVGMRLPEAVAGNRPLEAAESCIESARSKLRPVVPSVRRHMTSVIKQNDGVDVQ
jgi:hypothetical protein